MMEDSLTFIVPESKLIPPSMSDIVPPTRFSVPPSMSKSSGYVLEDALRAPVEVGIFSRVSEPPVEMVNFGLFVASDATVNTLRITTLQSSMFKSPVMVTFPSHVNVLVPPEPIAPSYPRAASGLLKRYAQSMLVPFSVTGVGSSLSSIESPTPNPPVGYQASVYIVSFCPDGPNATRLWSE